MALYDGFFDFDQEALQETGEYDREYNSADFTSYFEATIGSGVYVGKDPDSMRVSFSKGQASIAPGYLFLQGFWLKNTEVYDVQIPAPGAYAIVAQLDLGKRMISIMALPQAENYPDCLVLALLEMDSSGTGIITDTRGDAALCGLVDSAGSTAAKAAYAADYIDTQIEGRLQEAEADIQAKSAELDAKIAEVAAEVDKLAPPPVGTVQFTASRDVDESWLRCDGSFVNEQDYPQLVQALGKLIPSGDKFQLLSSGEVGQQISNGALYDGRMWVYSYSERKLYGLPLRPGQTAKAVTVTSTDSGFATVHPPTAQQPIALSIVPSPGGGGVKIFLAQILKTVLSIKTEDAIWIYSGTFSPSASSVSLTPAFQHADIEDTYFRPAMAVPYVASVLEAGVEQFYCVVGKDDQHNLHTLTWGGTLEKVSHKYFGSDYYINAYEKGQRIGFSPKNKGEAVWVFCGDRTGAIPPRITCVNSYLSGIFTRAAAPGTNSTNEVLTIPGPLPVAGADKLLFEMSRTAVNTISLRENTLPEKVEIGLSLPSAARIFADGGAYLWGKDIYMVFVGTGLVFSRTLEEGSFGYLDTTSVLGTITQFGYLDYAEDEEALYILGQDTTNKVKLAKIVLNTLYDYANDGAWLPMIASDGVPAYIKAKESAGMGEA